MQHDLESGLENMAEMLATAGGDTTGIFKLFYVNKNQKVYYLY